MPLGLRRFAGHRDARRAAQIAGPSANRQLRAISSGLPCATRWPPASPAPGPRSTTKSARRMVSSSCSTTSTVLPRSRKLLERAEQAIVIARVQADRRLVQHVQHAAQARADLRGEANALRFAAGQRGGGAIQAEIAESDGEQKIEALGNFLQRPAGDGFWRCVSSLENLGPPRGAPPEATAP